jgi:hypothetical protein
LALNTQKISGITQEYIIATPPFIFPSPNNGYILNNSINYLDSNLSISQIDTFYANSGAILFYYFWIPNSKKSVYGVTIKFNNGAPFGSLFVAKTDQDGRVNIIIPKPTIPLKIYPNPAKYLLNLQLQIIDLLGKVIFT